MLMSGLLDPVINLFRYPVGKYREHPKIWVAHRDTLPGGINCFELAQHERAASGSRNEEVRSGVIVSPIKPLDGILQLLELLFNLHFVCGCITICCFSIHCLSVDDTG